MERDILKKAAAYFAKASLPGTRADGYAATSIFLSMMCRVLQVSRSGFMLGGGDHLETAPPGRTITGRDSRAHERARWTYGPERLQRDLAAHGVQVGVHRIKRIRRQLGAGAG